MSSAGVSSSNAGVGVSSADVENLSSQLQQIPKQTGTLIMDHTGIVAAVSRTYCDHRYMSQPYSMYRCVILFLSSD
jgi:hypothetical protein